MLDAVVCYGFAPFEKFMMDFRIRGCQLIIMFDWAEIKIHWLLALAVVASEDSRLRLTVF